MRSSLSVLVYSSNANTRAEVLRAAGTRPAADLPPITWRECATLPALLRTLERDHIDACVLDAESTPAGGMGVCRQIKNEVFRCPPVLLLIARPQDAWLAGWSQADDTLTSPVDPLACAASLAALLRARPARPAGS
ncbi:DNA-binding response regulator [Streptomyces sp. ms191]|uniref:response regulator transcription factor n=1 Tax=Streptomyces sp. ms191 TaxID=1827978 RepID=UPI0011CE78FB|nr:response regulator transcription factor [Streptomyces sp. ms191]TXS22891.1 DNA-binding response regulator [Streptomyces sp. ms191]